MFPGGANETTALDPELSAAPLTVEKKKWCEARTVDHCFPVFSTIQGKTRTKPLLSLLHRGSTVAVITPMRQAHTYGRVKASGPTPSAPNTGS